MLRVRGVTGIDESGAVTLQLCQQPNAATSELAAIGHRMSKDAASATCVAPSAAGFASI
jgi:hypothetical protein